MVLSNGPIRKWWEILVKTVKSMDRQVLIIHDYSAFEWSSSDSEIESDSIERESESGPNSDEIWWPILKLIFGYTIYMVPIWLLFTIFSFKISKTFVCHNLHAPFLLNNDLHPSPFVEENGNSIDLSFEELYQLRLKSVPYKSIWNLTSISDLLQQYNYAGYHDICIHTPRCFSCQKTEGRSERPMPPMTSAEKRLKRPGRPNEGGLNKRGSNVKGPNVKGRNRGRPIGQGPKLYQVDVGYDFKNSFGGLDCNNHLLTTI